MVKTLSIPLPSEHDTTRIATKFAGLIQPGDVLLLDGEIGAGKSAFARALIRAFAGAEIEVPSPTFTLVQTYTFDALTIWHCDLYRLSHSDEALELGLDEAFETDVSLIEWPDRLGDLAPKNALRMSFKALPDRHHLEISASDTWADRLGTLND